MEVIRDRELHEECGVFGIYGVPNAASLTYYGLHALQHRGQEGPASSRWTRAARSAASRAEGW